MKKIYSELRYTFLWLFLRILLFNIVIAGTGVFLIVYELFVNTVGLRTAAFDNIANFFGSTVTFVGVILTALSVYFYKFKPTKPDPASKWGSAPLVIAGCLVCLYFVFFEEGVPQNIVNGFALLGIAGALFRIQPNPQRAVSDF